MTKKTWCQMILTFVVVAATTVNATEFHVKEFGAKGDGKSDDGPAIQSAFDAAKKAGGKTTVILEKKRYPAPPVEAFLKANKHNAWGGGGRHMIMFEKRGKEND